MEFAQGLYVTVMGMGLVFLSLAVLMGAIVLLDCLFPHREKAAKPEATATAALTGPAAALATTAPSPQGASPASQLAGPFDAILGGQTHRVELKDAASQPMLVAVDGREYRVELRDVGSSQLVVDGRTYSAQVVEAGPDHVTVSVGDEVFRVELSVLEAAPVAPQRAALPPAGAPLPASAGLPVLAPLPGRILKVVVAPGDHVARGQELCVIEAMKMENSVRAPQDGVVREVRVQPGQAVAPGELLVLI